MDKLRTVRSKLLAPFSALTNYLTSVAHIFGARNIFVTSLIITALVMQANYLVTVKIFIDENTIPGLAEATIFFFLLMATLAILAKINFLARLISKSANHIDLWILIIFFVSLECSIIEFFVFLPNDEVFNIVLRITAATSFVLLSIRAIYLNMLSTKAHDNNQSASRIFDLKTLLCDPDKISTSGKGLFYLDDKEVDYDLLNRDKEITEISTAIQGCSIHDHINIAVKGEWGSGKSTTLRNVKRKMLEAKANIIFIDDFEPWECCGEDDILAATYDAILRGIHPQLELGDIKQLVNTCVSPIQKVLGIAIPKLRVADANRLKKLIDDYIQRNNQKIVLVFDNLERCSEDNILAVLRIVHNLKINGLVCILSFDDTVMRKVFDKMDIEYSYLEKIIQAEFMVPRADRARIKNLITMALSNYFRIVGWDKAGRIKNNSDKLIEEIMDHIKTLRDLKRLINSVFCSSIENGGADPFDMFLAKMIQFTNPALYKEISENGRYFADRGWPTGLFGITRRYPDDCTKYIKKLFADKQLRANDYKLALSDLFPCIQDFFMTEAIDELSKNEPSKTESVNRDAYYDEKDLYANLFEHRARNKNFFGEFFVGGELTKLYLDKNTTELINLINSKKSIDREIKKRLGQMSKTPATINVAITNLGCRFAEVERNNLDRALLVLCEIGKTNASLENGQLILAMMLLTPDDDLLKRDITHTMRLPELREQMKRVKKLFNTIDYNGLLENTLLYKKLEIKSNLEDI